MLSASRNFLAHGRGCVEQRIGAEGAQELKRDAVKIGEIRQRLSGRLSKHIYRIKDIALLMDGQIGNLSKNIETIGKYTIRNENFIGWPDSYHSGLCC